MEKIKNKNSKEKLLLTAAKLFAQKGFDGVSTREICKEAGVNLCMISYYFGGKKELYQGILRYLIENVIKYSKTFLELDKPPESYSKKEQIDLLYLMVDKLIDFFYLNISSDLIIFLLKEQQKSDFKINSPVFDYLRSLIACIFNKKKDDREIIFRTLFIIAQCNSPKILPAFSLRELGQDQFVQEDIKIIKENVKFYIGALLKDAKIN